MLRCVEATLACLRRAGLSYEVAEGAWNAMDNHIYGFTLQAVNFPPQPSDYPGTAREFLPKVASTVTRDAACRVIAAPETVCCNHPDARKGRTLG